MYKATIVYKVFKGFDDRTFRPASEQVRTRLQVIDVKPLIALGHELAIAAIAQLCIKLSISLLDEVLHDLYSLNDDVFEDTLSLVYLD